MTAITFDQNCQAIDAVKEALSGVDAKVRDGITRWVRVNTAFADLADMLAASIAHGYTPTIRPASDKPSAVRDAELVASAYDAACTWAFGAGTGRRAFRSGFPRPDFRRNTVGC